MSYDSTDNRGSVIPSRISAAILGTLLAAGLHPAANAYALPIPTACQNDFQGANDEPGQKDLTKFCADDGAGTPHELHTIVNWDEISLGGANTADICTLYDSDENSLADLAVCVTLVGGAGDIAVLGEVRLLRCDDSKPDRCPNATLVSGPFVTVCEVSQQKTDPFSPAATNGPGDEYPNDTELLCAVDLDEFGPTGQDAVLLDACSYPSTEPNSDPSDCVAFRECESDEVCEDNNVCTTDNCDHNGFCVNKPRKGNVDCNDGLFCNGDDTCNASGLCQPGNGLRDCSDDVDCTTDTCNEFTDQCIHTPQNSLCTDGDFCNGVETCSAVNDCQAGTPPNCSDNVSCTTDTCNESTDSCDHAPSNGACNNGQFCDGSETCDALLGCRPGTPPNCADDVTCTNDSCNESTDSCVNAPSNAACSDNQFCTGTEICDPEDGCQPGTPPNCDDGIACTGDSCNEAADRCDHLPDNGECDNGEFCDGNEVCDPVDGCEPGPDPCPELCNEETNQCVECLTDGDCNDSLFCNGVETCNVQAGTCVPGTPPNCNDGLTCTADSCNEAGDNCTNAPNNTLCSDGQFCNGVEVCTVGVGCESGTAPDCADAVSCTNDACDEVGDTCTHTPVDANCSNGLFCDGTETCDAVNGCQDADAPDCDDAFACTTDSCNETLDRCDHIPDNTPCADGLFCNGVEVCNVAQGCIAGTPVVCSDAFICSLNTCNETTDLCVADFTPCVCGDNEVTGSEVCDPPAMAGSYEDCHNGLDDDGDGEIDCRDKSCKPGARPVVCDAECTLDQVCTKFIRDPAVITFNRVVDGLDVLYIHGRIEISGNPDPLTEGMTFEIMNEYNSIYRAELGWGDFAGRPGGKNFVFRDPVASMIGQASMANGLALARLKFRLFRGKPNLVFTIRAFGDMGGADRWLMTTELKVGAEVGYLTEEWKASRSGWTLHQKDF